MRSPRGPLNPGPIALLLVASVAIPEVLKQCKPLAKSVGDLLVKAGEELRKMAGTDEPTETPNDPVNAEGTEEAVVEVEEAEVVEEEETTKEGAATEDMALDTASPTGHEEVESQIAAEAKGDADAPAPSETKPRRPKKAASETPQPMNPKGRTAPKPA